MIKLYPYQKEALKQTQDNNHVAYYLDMGLGKTYVGSEKMMQLGKKVNLVICQKSKIDDWIEHFRDHYELTHNMMIYDCTRWSKGDWLSMKSDPEFIEDHHQQDITVLIINYDLVFRRPELAKLENFTLMLDESSLIQNENSKRSKFILKKLNPKNVILLSGTPTGGKYERLWSQMSLLGWKISKQLYYKQYVDFHYDDKEGFPIMIIDGYKNVERLKQKMRDHGCVFMKTEEAIELPEQIHNTIKVDTTKEYRKFRKNCIVTVNNNELVGDTSLIKLLYERQLCGHYNDDKLKAFTDLLESTNDRLIVFYNFNDELNALKDICEALERPYSQINGNVKDLYAYEHKNDSVTFCQYQAGAMGHNLQLANHLCYFTPPLSSELFEQSKKRIHRVGQGKTCFYYYLTCKGSIEEKIYKTLEMRRDYTDALFERGE